MTKANIMKKTDGNFLNICREVAKEYPEIETDSWFIDIMAANLVNKEIRNNFQVFVLPNLYGDIITDEAAQIQAESERLEVRISAEITRYLKQFTAVLHA